MEMKLNEPSVIMWYVLNLVVLASIIVAIIRYSTKKRKAKS